MVGNIYCWGQGVAIDKPRAMAAYKVAAEGGDASCQHQVGYMYFLGHGVDVDYAQAQPWIENAAAQDHPSAGGELGAMYGNGKGVTPSWRRAREYYERAIGLGNPQAVEDMQTLTKSIQNVTSRRSNHSAPSSLVRDLSLTYHTLPASHRFPHTRRPPPSWTSGWRSTARAART